MSSAGFAQGLVDGVADEGRGFCLELARRFTCCPDAAGEVRVGFERLKNRKIDMS